MKILNTTILAMDGRLSRHLHEKIINAMIGGVGILIGPWALKSLNSIEKIQPRMMVAMFNGNPSATIISYYKNAAGNIEQVLEVTLYKAAAVQPPSTHHENYQS